MQAAEMSGFTFSVAASMVPHLQKVLDGEYQIDQIVEPPKVILDIGANVGAFAFWAHNKWPEAKIYCYEPEENNFSQLSGNAKFAVCERVAVVGYDEAPETKLYLGRNNCGEHSLFLTDEQREDFQTVKTIPASTLPPSDFIKLDCEGSELPILMSYLEHNHPFAIALEWHRFNERKDITAIIMRNGYTMTDEPWSPNRGIIKAWIG